MNDDQNKTPVSPPPPPSNGPAWANTPAPQPTQPPAGTTTPTIPGLTDQPTRTFSQPEAAPSTLQQVAGGFRVVAGAVFSWIIFPIAVVLILHNFVFQAYHVLGTSMVPTLHESDYLIISKLGHTKALVSRVFGQNDVYIPERSEIIVFHYPKDPTKVFVKRVIGTPGDRVVIKSGQVTVFNKDNPDGFNPDAKYEPQDTATFIDTDQVVQDGHVFVLGDNRTPGGSYDSREWGELPSSYIIGDAVLRLLPLDKITIL